MEIQGERRRSFSLRPPPIKAQTARRGRSGRTVPVFEPYEEMLPLQSGHYSYVIDARGDFHVKRGNTSSHASMAGGTAIAAGMFRVNRLGSVIEVACGCTDFKFHYDDILKNYLITCFRNHHAFNLNPRAVFRFRTWILKSTSYTADGALIGDKQAQALIDAMLAEGLGDAIDLAGPDHRPPDLSAYTPPQPPNLYAMHLDQLVVSVEDSDTEAFEYGPAAPRFGASAESIRSGKNNFVIDRDGWLIVGFAGHQILSGGQSVGGAGHLTFAPSGEVTAIDLNFSGHYRPDLSADYVRYVYSCVKSHPLIRLSETCRFAGRKFKDLDANSTVIRFDREDLESADDRLDLFLEQLNF